MFLLQLIQHLLPLCVSISVIPTSKIVATATTAADDYYESSPIQSYYISTQQEIDALHEIYNSTRGENWTYPAGSDGHWNFTVYPIQPCSMDGSWQGVICDCSSEPIIVEEDSADNILVYYNYYMCNITQLSLIRFNLDGTLPNALGDFPLLTEILILLNPDLVGPIPATIGSLRNLLRLEMYGNSLSQQLPVELGQLTQLTSLYLAENYFSGSLGSWFGNLSSLTTIYLFENMFSGPLDTIDWGRMQNLRSLDIQTNFFSSHLPESLSELPVIYSLLFSDNMFSGTFPRSYCNIPFLSVLIQYNALTGTFPDCGGNWSSVSQLKTYYNHFSGPLPGFLASFTENLPNLYYIDMSSNMLTGTVPAAFMNASGALEYLHLNDNLLTGTLAKNLDDSGAGYYVVELQNNFLSGTLGKSFFANWTYLEELFFYNNAFSGYIPDSLSTCSNLFTVQLQMNKFRGLLTGKFDPSTQQVLSIIQLSDNKFTGTIPASIFELRNLSIFAGLTNCFDGPLPKSICNSNSLELLLLDGLHTATACRDPVLNGLIPDVYTLQTGLSHELYPCLFTMPRLRVLHLSGTGLTGQLPGAHAASEDALNLSTSPLNSLALSHNSLTGEIPLSLQRKNWSALDLSYNRLSGELDDHFSKSFEKSDASLNLKVNRLSGRIPSSLKYVTNVSILGGNMFSCDFERTQLPAHDPEQSSYSCGSDSFNNPYYLWLGIFMTVFVIFGGLCWFNYRYYQQQGSFACFGSQFAQCCQERISQINIYMSVFEEEDFPCYTTNDSTDSIAPIMHILPLPRNVRMVARFLEVMRQLAVLCFLYAVVLLVPIYIVCGLFYSTYTKQYAWTVSASFISGEVTLALTMSAFILFLCIFVALFYRLMSYRVSYSRAPHMPMYVTPTASLESSVSPVKQDRVLAEVTESGSRGTFHNTARRTLSTVHSNMNTLATGRPSADSNGRSSSRLDSTASSIMYGGTNKTGASMEIGFVGLQNRVVHFLSWLLILLLNATAVIAVNVAFVYVSVYEGDSYHLFAAQVGLALFKYSWGSKGLRWVVNFILSLSEDVTKPHVARAIISLELLAALFNNILIPCLVVVAVDPDCFYNFLVAASPVTSTYAYTECTSYIAPAGKNSVYCTEFNTFSTVLSFDPPFTYSYQCSASFTTYYASTFIYFCVLVGFALPAQQLAAYWLYFRAQRNVSSALTDADREHAANSWWLKILRNSVPRILLSVSAEIERVSLKTHKESSRNQSRGSSSSSSSSSCNSSSISSGSDINGVGLVRKEAGSTGVLSVDCSEKKRSGSVANSSNSSMPLSCSHASSTGQQKSRSGAPVYFDATRCRVMIATLLGLLMTFGVVFPPLGAALTFTLLSYSYFTQLKLGRFIVLSREGEELEATTATSRSREAGYSTHSSDSGGGFEPPVPPSITGFERLRIVNRECTAFDLSLMRWIWVFVTLSCWFYGFILFDVLGDKERFHGAWWVLLVMGSLPLLLYVMCRIASTCIVAYYSSGRGKRLAAAAGAAGGGSISSRESALGMPAAAFDGISRENERRSSDISATAGRRSNSISSTTVGGGDSGRLTQAEKWSQSFSFSRRSAASEAFFDTEEDEVLAVRFSEGQRLRQSGSTRSTNSNNSISSMAHLSRFSASGNSKDGIELKSPNTKSALHFV